MQGMPLAWLDWLVIGAYFALSLWVGLRFVRRAGRGAKDYFVAGRALPWWLAGTSMVATTFAADTPLAVTGLVAEHGLAGNWVWWNMVAGNLLTVFFFARLWHRAGVSTDAELTELRYSGRPAAILRGLRAAYLAVPINLIIMGWVNLAMVKILAVALEVPPFAAMLGLLFVTGVYVALAGLWGVVVTDALQFVVAMLGCVALAVVAVGAVGGLDGLAAAAAERFGSREAALGLLPSGDGFMPVGVFLIYLTVQWWSSWYPGSEPGGGGYVAQRIFSARSERDGMLACLWFTLAHYAVRPWPWILTALAVVVLYPGLDDPGSGFVRAAVELLPPGLKGLLLAAFAAAYMSTLSTQLNWGAAYLVNDLYLRFVAPGAPPRRVVAASRLATGGLLLASAGVTWWLAQAGSVEAAWRVLIALGAGSGAVYILRWFWWRINAWSEISAMLASLATFVALTASGVFDPADGREGALLMLWTTGLTSLVWVAVTLRTRPEPPAHLLAFYRKIRPGGPGWGPVRAAAALPREPLGGAPGAFAHLGLALVAVYGSLFGLGRLLLGPRWEAPLFLGAAALALAWLAWRLRRSAFQSGPRVDEPADAGPQG